MLGILLIKFVSSTTPKEISISSFLEFYKNDEYNSNFKINAEMSVKDSHGNWGSNLPSNAIDNDDSTFWESGAITSETVHPYFQITFQEKIETNRFMFLGREEYHRGFPLEFKVYVTETDDESNLELVLHGKIATNQITSDPFIIMLEKVENIKIFRFEFIHCNDDGNDDNQRYPSIREIVFYKRDELMEVSKKVFTDNTWSKFVPGFSPNSFYKLYDNYPIKSLFTTIYNEVKYIDQTSEEEIQKNIYKFECRGTHDFGLQIMGAFTSQYPPGLNIIDGETMEFFCEYGNNTQKPEIRFLSNMQNGGSIDFSTLFLNNGYTKVVGDTGTLESSFLSIFFQCIGKIGNGKIWQEPICRVKGGHHYPTFHLWEDDPLEFKKELEDYVTKVTTNKTTLKNDPINYVGNAASMYTYSTLIHGTALGILDGLNDDPDHTVEDLMIEYENLAQTFFRFSGLDGVKSYNYPPIGRIIGRVYSDDSSSVAGFACNNYVALNCYCFKEQKGGMASAIAETKYLRSSWLTYHEFGHQFDYQRTSIPELTNNYFSLMMNRHFTKKQFDCSIYHDGGKSYEDLMKYFTNNNIDYNEAMLAFRQLEFYFGANLHPMLGQLLRENNFSKYGLGDIVTESNGKNIIPILSYMTKTNLQPFFLHYNCPGANDEQIISYCEQFPEPAHPIEYLTERCYLYQGHKFRNGERANVKQITIEDESILLQFELENCNGNMYDNLLGFEILENDKVIMFTYKNYISISKTESANKRVLKVVPIDLTLNRGIGSIVNLDLSASINSLDRTNWKINVSGEIEQGYVKENMIDDRTDTCAHTKIKNNNMMENPNYIILDFGSEQEFNGFILQPYTDKWGLTYKYSVNISTDGETWERITKIDDDFNISRFVNYYKKHTVIFNKVYKARYFKFNQHSEPNGLDESGIIKICDFQVIKSDIFSSNSISLIYNYVGPLPIFNLTNLPEYLPDDYHIWLGDFTDKQINELVIDSFDGKDLRDLQRNINSVIIHMKQNMTLDDYFDYNLLSHKINISYIGVEDNTNAVINLNSLEDNKANFAGNISFDKCSLNLITNNSNVISISDGIKISKDNCNDISLNINNLEQLEIQNSDPETIEINILTISTISNYPVNPILKNTKIMKELNILSGSSVTFSDSAEISGKINIQISGKTDNIITFDSTELTLNHPSIYINVKSSTTMPFNIIKGNKTVFTAEMCSSIADKVKFNKKSTIECQEDSAYRYLAFVEINNSKTTVVVVSVVVVIVVIAIAAILGIFLYRRKQASERKSSEPDV